MRKSHVAKLWLRWVAALASIGGCLILVACAPIAEQKQQYHVIFEHQLHSGMNTMAGHLNTIANLAFEDSLPEEEKTPVVLRELNQIKSLATHIAGPGEVTNYSVINRYMDAFIYDVNVAEQFSQRSPPNHFPAYRLVKSCLSCHDSI